MTQAIPGTGIEISLDVPGHIKKKKKGFDVEAFLKREMARVQREVQVNIGYHLRREYVRKF